MIETPGALTSGFSCNDTGVGPPEEKSAIAPDAVVAATVIAPGAFDGADLRCAKIQGVDFYLVDLRGAKYTNVQGAYFKKCGAILHSRAA